MSSTLLVRDALSRVSDQLGDSNPQFSRWTQHTLVNYLNDAQRVLAKYLPHSCSRVDAIKLSPGTRQSLALVPAANIIPGDGSTAADSYGMRLLGMPRNMGSNGTTPGRVIRPVDRRTLDMADPGWHAKTGLYVTGFPTTCRRPKFVYVTPGVPASGPSGSRSPGSRCRTRSRPARPARSTRPPTRTPPSCRWTTCYFDDLVNYMLARAHMRDAEFAGAQQLAALLRRRLHQQHQRAGSGSRASQPEAALAAMCPPRTADDARRLPPPAAGGCAGRARTSAQSAPSSTQPSSSAARRTRGTRSKTRSRSSTTRTSTTSRRPPTAPSRA
jgi:hypothetical protein